MSVRLPIINLVILIITAVKCRKRRSRLSRWRCYCCAGGKPPKFSDSTVVVTVLDVNNKAPRFTAHTVTGEVSEDAPNGTSVLQVGAVRLTACLVTP